MDPVTSGRINLSIQISMVRCSCKTLKGARCKRSASSNSIFCSVHAMCKKPMTSIIVNTVMLHQTKRFEELRNLLKRDQTVKVILPGSGNTHSLGVGIARASWAADDYTKMHNHLNKLVKRLAASFPGRVSFGMVGSSAKTPPSNKVIHVWGANAGNWNLSPGSLIVGSGQASAMGKQRPGVFGIVTMPVTLKELPSLLSGS